MGKGEGSASALESLPLECIQTILGNLSDDCHALYALLLVNKAWFHMVLPFLYKSPMTLIDSTWPKLSSYSQILKKDLPLSSPASGYVDRPSSPMSAVAGPGVMFDEPRPALSLSNSITSASGSGAGVIDGTADTIGRHGRSLYSSNRRTSTTSSNGVGGGGYGGGFGYAPRTHSRSSSHSSTRSMTGDAFHQGRNDAVLQREQRDRLVKRKKMQVLWVLLNCTLSEEEHLARMSRRFIDDANDEEEEKEEQEQHDQDNSDVHSALLKDPSLLSLKLNQDLDINLEYFKPMVDYLSFYTHQYHPGLQYITWKLFPTMDYAKTIERRLIRHGPERIRELFLESVQLQDMVSLVSRLETLYKIRTCHEKWDIPSSIEFMRRHNELFGTVRMLEMEAYIPENHDTEMSADFGQLIGQVDHLKVLELSGFEALTAVLEDIPTENLKVLRLNCGSLGPTPIPPFATTEAVAAADRASNARMTINTFLSQCRQLEELLLKPVDESMLEWAVQERRDLQAGLQPMTPTSPSLTSLARPPPQRLVPLRIIELSGTDSEHVAMTISQAAEAFQDTLEVIKANSFSYTSNRTQKMLSWRFPMPKLRVIKIVGRSNLPFDFRSLQYCPELRILDLSKYSGMRGCQEAGLLNLKYLTKLEYLGLSSFDHLTDSTLRTILGCMPRLKHLRLAIGDTAVSTLGASSFAYASSGSIVGSGSGVGKVTGSRTSGILGGSGSGSGSGSGPGSNNGGVGGASSSNSSSAAAAGVASSADMPFRSPFAAISAASSAGSASASASVSSSTSPDPAPQPPTPQTVQQQPSMGTINMIVGQIQNQHSSFSHHHHSHHHHHQYPLAPPPSLSSTPFHSYMSGATAGGPIIGSGMSSSSSSVSGMGIGNGGVGSGDMASSARSTSSLMDRFHLENTYLSLEGILDAIDGLSEDKDKNQLEKLSIVLGKLDFDDHYRRLELYNQQYQDLEITVYRYAHAV
ncbi:hypothetical protein KI688_012201 [Linnemannia hyalina]|uniref:F-box domain-containing protein n=1 Tax=Linnemannia hyalina TaxID=64524 RepID=A0A9P8BTP0_9FUNG|nr:hypothetical protein KI688_012201 [Linnemannia hyalina]